MPNPISAPEVTQREVIQADRDAAASVTDGGYAYATNISLGHCDDHSIVQAFARHREESAAEDAARYAAACDAADAILAPICAAIGRVLIETQDADVVAELAAENVSIPAGLFWKLYVATDRNALHSGSAGK